MNKKQLSFDVRAWGGPAAPWGAGQGPHQPGPSPTVSVQGDQGRCRDGGQVQPGIQIIRQGHSDEDGPKPGQDVRPQVGPGSGLVRETRVRHSPSMAGLGHGGEDVLRPGWGVSPQVGPISAGPMARMGRAVVELEIHTPTASLGQGVMVLHWADMGLLVPWWGAGGGCRGGWLGLVGAVVALKALTQVVKSLSCHCAVKIRENPKS